MIKEISNEQYQAFIKDKVLDFYTQCSEVVAIATLSIKFLGYFNNGKLMAVNNFYTMKYKKIFKVAYFIQSEVFSEHMLSSMIVDYYQELKIYFKNKGYAYIDIYPTLCCGRYDIEGNLKQQYYNQKEMLSLLNVYYPKRHDFSIPNIMCIKTVDNLTPDTLIQGMSNNVKRLLKTANKENLRVRRMTIAELATIYPVFEASAERKNFDIFSLEKMKKILVNMPDNMYVDVVYVNRKEKIDILKQRLVETKEDKKCQVLQEQLTFLQQHQDEQIVLGAGLFYRNQQQIFYQMGGSYQLFNRWGTMIYLMYHQILQAHVEGLKYYNFGGIFCHHINREDFEEDSLYNFKRKFNGELLMYGEELIIPIKSWLFKLIKLT